MLKSIWSNEIRAQIVGARAAQTRSVRVGRRTVKIPVPFPSPQDWRDVWMYQLLMDRFNNSAAPPRAQWDAEVGVFQGGAFNGVREQLDYLKALGVGALWLSPVLKNCQYLDGTYHGYGIQDFAAIDPRFSSDPEAARANPELAENELRALIDEAHARDIYIVFDIVLNHTGDVFEYVLPDGSGADMAPWRDFPYPIRWRDADGTGRADWSDAPADPPPDAAVFPAELRNNEFFRRRGNAFDRPSQDQEKAGDFFSLKELVTEYQTPDSNYFPVQDILIHAHQYLIAKYDIDGFRIDTLKYIDTEFARVFGNAIREYALSIGKKNFLTFGEVYDNEQKIAAYIGRNACSDDGDLIGVDAALDFPLFYKLPDIAKGMSAPSELVNLYEFRKQVEKGILSSHGEASKFFVTFLDNHDQYHRFYYSGADDPHAFDEQLALGVGCLFALQGIPCLYYGTEQGLHGSGGSIEAVREALWGKPNAFNRQHPFFQWVQQLARVRANEPALRYGRQYFRPVSGDGFNFGISASAPGVVAFARILQDQEVLVVANTNTQAAWQGDVIVDSASNSSNSTFVLRFTNKSQHAGASPLSVQERVGGSVRINEVNGSIGRGPIKIVRVNLEPMEIQIWRNQPR